MKRLLKIWLLVQNNEPNPAPAPTPPAPEPEPSPDNDKPVISQKKLDSILAEEKKKYQKSVENQIGQLESLKKSAETNDKLKKDLENRIEELQNSLLTKEQIAQKDKDKLQKDFSVQIEKLSSERDRWKNSFTEATIKRSISDAAGSDAFSSAQIVNLLERDARLVEETDDEGNGLGKFGVKIKFQHTDKEGKPVTLDLTPDEAIKLMKDIPDKYGNLFKTSLSSGLGGGNNKPIKDIDLKNMSRDQYMEWRKKEGLGRQT